MAILFGLARAGRLAGGFDGRAFVTQEPVFIYNRLLECYDQENFLWMVDSIRVLFD
jgi:hypothetical protein